MSSDNKRKFVTVIKKVKASYEWEIQNFFLNNKKNGEALCSPSFSIDGDKLKMWNIKLYPSGEHETVQNFVSVFLHANYENVNLKVEFEISILNENNEKVKKYNAEYHFTKSEGYGWDKFTDIENLKKCRETLVPHNNLTICCDIEVGISDYSFDINHQSKYFETEEICSRQIKTCEDFGVFLKKQELTDITLTTSNHIELKAHKSILAARSPVFLAMFNNDMVEKLQNEVKIIDFDSKIVSEMLQFIYTGTVKNIEKNAFDLLRIADKYQIMELKNLCEDCLYSSVSIENVTDLLILADQNSKDFKTKLIKFILEHKKEIVKTVQFINLKSVKPNLIADILCFDC